MLSAGDRSIGLVVEPILGHRRRGRADPTAQPQVWSRRFGPVSDADIAHAVGELINIMAGGVKQRLQDATSGLRLGPVFIHGYVQPTQQLEVSLASARIGPVDAHRMACARHCPLGADPTPERRETASGTLRTPQRARAREAA